VAQGHSRSQTWERKLQSVERRTGRHDRLKHIRGRTKSLKVTQGHRHGRESCSPQNEGRVDILSAQSSQLVAEPSQLVADSVVVMGTDRRPQQLRGELFHPSPLGNGKATPVSRLHIIVAKAVGVRTHGCKQRCQPDIAKVNQSVIYL